MLSKCCLRQNAYGKECARFLQGLLMRAEQCTDVTVQFRGATQLRQHRAIETLCRKQMFGHLYRLIVIYHLFIFIMLILQYRWQLHTLLAKTGACDAHLSLGRVGGVGKEGDILHSTACRSHILAFLIYWVSLGVSDV